MWLELFGRAVDSRPHGRLCEYVQISNPSEIVQSAVAFARAPSSIVSMNLHGLAKKLFAIYHWGDKYARLSALF
jgi:hypothetical protein